MGLLSVILWPCMTAMAGEIALSFDDAPWGGSEYFTGMERTEAMIKSLKDADVSQVVFFCCSDRTQYQNGRKRLKLYAVASHLLANHSHSHPDLHKTDAKAFIEGIQQAHDSLSSLPGFIEWFRYPMLHEGKTRPVRDSVRNALEEMGYINGYVTVDNYDFYMESLFQRALRDGKEVDFDKLKDAYINILWSAIEFYDDIAVKTLGRSPKHVLLLHENDLAALFIDDLVKHIRGQGWEIISPAEAYTDPIATHIPDVLENGQGRVAAIAREKGYDGDYRHPTESVEYLDKYFEELEVFKADEK
ncbi:MAG: polysaccharide deacetylase family protein [candidate division Zixibacteria bacterium]|nr:polysaccharide deacetylase family protein [candidate division Zixibacteria bacterium]